MSVTFSQFCYQAVEELASTIQESNVETREKSKVGIIYFEILSAVNFFFTACTGDKETLCDYYLQASPYLKDTEVGLNIFLYLGLGMVAIGLVLTVVGVGEKGFRTLEMRLLGPALMVEGIVLAF